MKVTPCLGIVLLMVTGCSHMRSTVLHRSGAHNTRDAQLSVGRVYEDQGDLEKARTIYQQLVESDPKHVVALHRLGVVEAKQLHFEESRKYLEQARAITPDNSELLTDIGYTYYLEGNLEMASEVLNQALTYKTDNDRARNNLGLVLGRQRRYDESFAMFRAVVGDAKAHANVAFIQAQNGDAQAAEKHFSRALDLDQELRSASDGLLQLAQTQNNAPAVASTTDESAKAIQTAAASNEPGAHQHFDVRGTSRQETRRFEVDEPESRIRQTQANAENEAVNVKAAAYEEVGTAPAAKSPNSPASGSQRTTWATTTRPGRHESLIAPAAASVGTSAE